MKKKTKRATLRRKPSLKKKAGKSRSAKSSKKPKKLTKAELHLQVNEQALQELIARGRTRGFETDSEVLHYFPHIEEDVGFLERIYDELERVNVKVVETQQLIELPTEEVSEKELKAAVKISGADELPDSVQMY